MILASSHGSMYHGRRDLELHDNSDTDRADHWVIVVIQLL